MKKEYPEGIDVQDEVMKFASRYGHGHDGMRRNGAELNLKYCPFCRGGQNHDRNSFSINLKTGQYKCLRANCNKSGNLYTLSEDPSIDYQLPVPEPTRREIRKHSYRMLTNKDKWTPDPEAIKYLGSRGISKEIVEKYQITISHKEYEGWLVWPFITTDDKLVYVKYRNLHFKKGDKNKEYSAKKEDGWVPALFGMKQCNMESDVVVMTEGQPDTLSCAMAGVDYAVSVPTGQGGFKWFEESEESRQFLNRFDELIIFGDHENGHITLVDGMRTRFNGRIRVVRPEDYCGCKDANEMLQKEGVGAEGIRKAIKQAELLPIRRTKDIAEITAKNMIDAPYVPTGIYSLDRLLHGGMRFGQLMLITGERGKGKSTWLSQIALYAVRSGENIFFYSGEMPETEWLDWFLRQAAGEEHVKFIKNRFGDSDYYITEEKRNELISKLTGRVRIYDNEYIPESQEDDVQLIEVIKESIKRSGCRVICLDNLMTAIDDDLNVDIYRKQAKFINELAVIARRYNVIIYLVAHPKKMPKGTDNFDMDNVLGSSNITNLANVVVRYDVPSDAEDRDTPDRKLYVYKARGYGKTNRKGIDLHYLEASKRIYGDDDDYKWELFPKQSSDPMDGFEVVQQELDIPF